MSAADLEAGVVAYLKSVADLTGLMGGARVFAGELPARETGTMPRKAVVLRRSGGVSLTGGSHAETDAQRIDLFSYGETPLEAGRVMATAALAMRRLRRGVYGGVLLHGANPAGGSIPGREPQTEWARQFQPFQVMYALEAAA